MGQSLSYFQSALSFFRGSHSSTPVRVLILGLDDAGKTTLLTQIAAIASGRPPPTLETEPTIGFNTQVVTFDGVTLEAWDLGGQTVIRPLWRCYFSDTTAVVFVVDSVDRERMPMASRELHALLLEPELAGIPLLVVANKMDIACASPVAEVASLCDLAVIVDRPWTLCAVSALQGTGVKKAMESLVGLIR